MSKGWNTQQLSCKKMYLQEFAYHNQENSIMNMCTGKTLCLRPVFPTSPSGCIYMEAFSRDISPFAMRLWRTLARNIYIFMHVYNWIMQIPQGTTFLITKLYFIHKAYRWINQIYNVMVLNIAFLTIGGIG